MKDNLEISISVEKLMKWLAEKDVITAKYNAYSFYMLGCNQALWDQL